MNLAIINFPICSAQIPADDLEIIRQSAAALKRAPAMLSTRGYGDTKPRVQNDTEYGRFQNRRIEFTVVQ